jgi:hypothetical protein
MPYTGAAVTERIDIDIMNLAPLFSGKPAVLEIRHVGCPLL